MKKYQHIMIKYHKIYQCYNKVSNNIEVSAYTCIYHVRLRYQQVKLKFQNMKTKYKHVMIRYQHILFSYQNIILRYRNIIKKNQLTNEEVLTYQTDAHIFLSKELHTNILKHSCGFLDQWLQTNDNSVPNIIIY